MPIALPVARDEITAELDYERGRLVYEGVNGNEVRRSILPGGVRVITERMPGTRGVSLGFWVGSAPGMKHPVCWGLPTFWSICSLKELRLELLLILPRHSMRWEANQTPSPRRNIPAIMRVYLTMIPRWRLMSWLIW